MIRYSPDESQEPSIVPVAPPAEEPTVAMGPAPESSALVVEAAPAAMPKVRAKPKAKAKAKPKPKAKAKPKAKPKAKAKAKPKAKPKARK